MKTHLPKGLRAALMAALASFSISTAYADATLIKDQYAVDWSKVTPDRTSSIQGANIGTTVFSPTIPAPSPSSWYAPSTNSKYTGYTGTDLKYINVVRTETAMTLGDVYFDMVGGKADYGISGLANAPEKTANIYVRVGESASAHTVTFVRGSEYTTLKGNSYVELADSKATYIGPVGGAHSSNNTGSSTIVIRDGKFNSWVAAGFSEAAKAGYTIGGGTYLQIENGTFNSYVMGGTSLVGNTATINGGSHLLIKNGTFNKDVYGGSAGAYGVVNGGVDITVSGGTFNTGSNIYALGSNGKVSGAVSLTIGNNAKFSSNSVISAGANDTKVNYSGVTSSTVTLSGLTGTSSLASDSSIKVMGGQQGSSLVMNNVIGTINAQLSQFSDMQVLSLSNLTLRQATNEALGGVSKVRVVNGSSLTLDNEAGQTWDLSGVAMVNVGTLNKTGAGKLTIGDATGFDGTINVQSGGLTLSGATKAGSLTVANGATLSVKEGDLFTGAEGAGSSISVSGATLAANEGNWTLNKAATINGVTITGEHAVGLGSEVDSNAKVTMSGNINATDGHLILKNTTVATTGATLSGNLTFEGTVDNKGTLTIANGSTINIDEESLIRNGRFIDGTNTSASDKNGFFADTEVCLSTGGAYSYDKEQLTLTLDGVKDSRLELLTDREKNQLLIGGLSLANTYFVREGDVSYSHITDVAATIHRDVLEIAVGTDGVGNIHQLTLDKTLAGEVTVVSASDHAKVSISEGVELKASQTAIKGEANEVHVTGAGTVLMDNADKLSTLAGDATMKVDTNTVNTLSGEAKMEGALKVVGNSTLTVTDAGTIASFSSVNLAENTKLANEVAAGHEDSIKSLSGSGTLEKTGAGKLAISGDSSGFANGSVNIGAGTLEVQNNMKAASLSGSGKLAKTGEDTKMTVKDASGFTGDIEAIQGTLELEGVALTGAKTQKISVSTGATVNLVDMQQGTDGASIELSIDGGTFGVYADGQAVTNGDVTGLTLAGGSKITIGAGTDTNVLEANLATLSGSILDFSSGGQLTMGCTLEVGKGTIIVLSDDNYALASEGVAVTLFNDVDNTEMENYVRVTLKSASGEQMLGEVNFQSESGDIKLTVKGVPEPTTGTLSLLALAGLCARRRRKH